jgi:hypothetical protein
MVKASLRTKSVGTKVTDAEYAALEGGSVQSFSHFRSSSLCWKVVRLRLFCSWPPRGPGAKRSGDGHDFGQAIHLQVAFGAPLGCGNMP